MRNWLHVAVAGIVACAAARAADVKASLIRIDGAIGPATAEYVSRAISTADNSRARCLIIELDTPGGLLESTKQIVQAFYRSKVPVIVYVTPPGANAGSAGCFITLAADVAAMAPNTSIGAAHPVELGGVGESKPSDVMTKKMENFATSYIEAIADKRHRNVEWAKAAVRDSASVTAEKALELKVIDLIASDVPDLLRQLDGRDIGGRVLRTAGIEVQTLPMLARERIFQGLWRPEVMFVLMLIGIYGIIGELSDPGAVLPGVAGVIALILALYMASVLPISIAGVALVLLAVALFVTDVFAPTHGALTAGGIIAFFLGSLLLFEPGGPAFRLPLTVIVPATVVTAAFFVFVVGAGLRAQKLPHRVGRETMLGKTVPALTQISADSGTVFIEGERWNARSETPIGPGDPVEIERIVGLTLYVKPKK
ncbi:MAG TPA: nodulation protein NfeD [Opitutaceae bacterium]|nr:nodulation protein NfeD [Opitutaceae bacterium]